MSLLFYDSFHYKDAGITLTKVCPSDNIRIDMQRDKALDWRHSILI